MVYRDQRDADAARIAQLEDSLRDEERAHAQTREALAELRRKYARARSVLAMIAHSRKVAGMLEEAKVSKDELDEMTRPPTERPAALPSDGPGENQPGANQPDANQVNGPKRAPAAKASERPATTYSFVGREDDSKA